jgi:nicotinate-nucleotide pyrophosphorylase (carboxylating)
MADNVNAPLPEAYEPILRAALTEDIGTGDITSELTIPTEKSGHASMIAKADGVIAGLAIACRTFTLVDESVHVTLLVGEGEQVKPGTMLANINGPARSLLAAERVALNLVQRMSGIATLTRRFVNETVGTSAKILDTRKTTPNLRILEKYAVQVGGGINHRMGLYDAILIKDNHIAAGGGVTAVLQRVKTAMTNPLPIEIECKTLEEVDEAVAVGVDIILLDNMGFEQMGEAVRRIASRAQTEASGGVNLNTVGIIAKLGVNRISVGALTHSAPALDISLDLDIT